ncbi:uncharacterized protein LOC110991090 [Acanthaster planci]|uniref:Uncharacterized protein LOC110991090 n=1 Tax=Acanthaster planci TaxID=133434 RepID=A0A8B8A3J3_ACAPL|nr:uncharacterized protein LOC110991090 [Acanthaster planci]XP_022111947.1 uncharacterized protein LOC110991090 [Acanthaster planci]XP_022111948.1 uncharacterized protein LOC110991090 [Acanthaster planci]XP_022111949.1 uncharacterized protein LOC110991090 [Acanthaster planci]
MAMRQIKRNSQMSSLNNRAGPPLVSNKPGEPMALFAVPLPSSCRSDFLCLCKRLFWNVGTSYFSAFCPLTVGETRLLPHSSAVVQLVSVTPAVSTGQEGKQATQDLLAYTSSGDIVGIPYVSISRDHHPRGKLAKGFPFGDLTTSAWVPAINAPYVGGTTGIPSKQDVFIIRNDQETRKSLLKGDNVVFSQPDSKKCDTSAAKETLPVQDLQGSPDHEVPQTNNSPQKENDRSSKMSPASSSLYKLYTSNRRDQETTISTSPKGNQKDSLVKESFESPTTPEKCTKYPSMVLPQIDAVFSLAGSTSDNESLSKRIADTLAKRNTSLLQNQEINTSLPIGSCITGHDSSTQQGCGNPVKDSLSDPLSPNPATPASQLALSPSSTSLGSSIPPQASGGLSLKPLQTCSLESVRQPGQRPETQTVDPLIPSPPVKASLTAQAQPPFTKSAKESVEITTRNSTSQLSQGQANLRRSHKKLSGFTVREILMSRRLTTPSQLVTSANAPAGIGTPAPIIVPLNGSSAAVNLQSCSVFQNNPDVPDRMSGLNTTRLASVSESSCGCAESKQTEVPSLKMVIKTERDCDNNLRTTCHPVGSKLFDRDKILSLKIPKIDISGYDFVDPALIMEDRSDVISRKNAIQESSFFGDTATLEGSNKHGELQSERKLYEHIQVTRALKDKMDTNIFPTTQIASLNRGSYQTNKHKRRRSRFRLSLSKKGKSKLSHDQSKLHSAAWVGKRNTAWLDGRERLSDCQNRLSERSKRPRLANSNGYDASFSGSFFQSFAQESLKLCESVEDTQNNAVESGRGSGKSTPRVAHTEHETLEDPWSDASSSTGSEWECPDKSSVADVDSDWDSSLEDEVTSSPVKCVQPIKMTPFGDFQHMVLKDRLRLLEQSLKEHQTVLNSMKRPLESEQRVFAADNNL